MTDETVLVVWIIIQPKNYTVLIYESNVAFQCINVCNVLLTLQKFNNILFTQIYEKYGSRHYILLPFQSIGVWMFQLFNP